MQLTGLKQLAQVTDLNMKDTAGYFLAVLTVIV
jgi:hypothetical protein